MPPLSSNDGSDEPVYMEVSPFAPIIAAVEALRERIARQESGVCYANGIRNVIRAVECKFEVVELIHCPQLLRSGNGRRQLTELASSGVPVTVVDADTFRSLAPQERASGLSAVIRWRELGIHRARPARAPGWVVVESLRSESNFGSIMRTADAVGAAGVMMVGDAIDPWAPRSVRASMGSIFGVPLVRTDRRGLRRWLHRHRIELVATDSTGAEPYHRLAVRGPVAFAFGDERRGVSPWLRRLATRTTSIPMRGGADSLNVAVAPGIVLFGVRDQR